MSDNQLNLIYFTVKNLQIQSEIVRGQSQAKKRRAEFYRTKARLILTLLSSPYAYKLKRTLWTLRRTTTFWEDEVPQYTDVQFKNNFRISRSTYKYIVNSLNCLAKSDTSIRKCISLEKRIALTLYTIGSSSEYRTIASLFGVGRTKVGEIVLEVCEALWNQFQEQFLNYFPPTQTTVEEIVEGFENKWGFPQCFGAVDGCHIEIKPPREYATDYYNNKGWYSIVLLACADYRCRFTYINIGAAGRNHDSFIYEQSLLKKQIEENEIFTLNSKEIAGVSVPVVLLGDSAFKLSLHLLKPFPFSLELNKQQSLFNGQLSRSRRVIENAFRHLKARFCKIGKGLETTIPNAKQILKACCVLHNICNEMDDIVYQHWMEKALHRPHQMKSQPTFRTTAGDNNLSGNTIRTALCNHFGSQQGIELN